MRALSVSNWSKPIKFENISCPWISAVNNATTADFIEVDVVGLDSFNNFYIANAPSATFSEDFCIDLLFYINRLWNMNAKLIFV